MAQSQTGIVNLALMRIGANIIVSIDENSTNAIKAKAVWDYCLYEVLQSHDWKFAKTRAKLTQSTTAPEYAYQFAYELPSDFLRLVRERHSTSKGINPVAYPAGVWYYSIDTTGYSRFYNFDPPVYPPGFPYVIETLPSTGVMVLLTDYDNTAYDLYVNYIKKVTDATKYTPAFCNCLANRLAQELAIPITEDKAKFDRMALMYKQSVYSAEAVNESTDYVMDETGSTEWENAGR